MKRILLCTLIALHTTYAQTAEMMVFAAASLTESLRQIASDYSSCSSDRILFNFAASGTLARQIEEGAPADIFFSADEARFDSLVAKGLLSSKTRVRRLANTLVLVVPRENRTIRNISDLARANIGRVAIGDPKTVPAGAYARAYLEKLGLWASVEPKSIRCESVRAVLTVVESGDVDAGIVYRTDARISKKVNVAVEVPEGVGPTITYPVAIVKGAPALDAAERFLAFLNSEVAGEVFRKAGFTVLEDGN